MIEMLRDAPPLAAVMIVVGGVVWIAAGALRAIASARAKRAEEQASPIREDSGVRRWLAAEILGAVTGAAGLAWYVLAS
jgi:hypothetical protein